jgi:hypothetical protein
MMKRASDPGERMGNSKGVEHEPTDAAAAELISHRRFLGSLSRARLFMEVMGTLRPRAAERASRRLPGFSALVDGVLESERDLFRFARAVDLPETTVGALRSGEVRVLEISEKAGVSIAIGLGLGWEQFEALARGDAPGHLSPEEVDAAVEDLRSTWDTFLPPTP